MAERGGRSRPDSGLLLVIAVIAVSLPMAYSQSPRAADTGDDGDMVLAALVVGVVACVGVMFLSIFVFCLLARYRKGPREWRTSDDLVTMEKASIDQTRGPAYDSITPNEQSAIRQGSVSVGAGTLRQVSLSLLQDLLLNLYNVSVKRADHVSRSPPSSSANTASRKDSATSVTAAGADEVQKQLKNGLVKIFPQDRGKVDTFLSVGQAVMGATSVRQLLDSALRAMRLCLGQVREWGVLNEDYAGVVPTEGQGHVSVVVEDEVNTLTLTWDSHKFGDNLQGTVSRLCQALRDERRQPTAEEYLAMQLAYYALGKGQPVTDVTHRPLGSPGFHPHAQTQVALTDSGYGHVLGTTRRWDWLQGVVVHVQHIGGLGDTDLAPSLYDLGKVRLHVGSSAPTTFYVTPRGVANVHNNDMTSAEAMAAWEAEVGRVVQQTANAISSAFYQGAAACHVSMAGLTTTQAATFMAQLRPQVQRERHLQALSAVWDLGSPLTDDYGITEVGTSPAAGTNEPPAFTSQVKVLHEAHHIARRAIDITLAGGFDQVTWFSNCDETRAPSERCKQPPTTTTNANTTNTTTSSNTSSQSQDNRCVVQRLTSQQILSLVHQAHSRGLLTYFTGGVTCQDIQPAVYGGVDGVGVGGVGMLHHAKTGRNASERHGPYMEENIPQVLACRDEASNSLMGRAAQLLSRLDTMFFEGSLASAENGLRSQLYNAIVDKDQAVITSVMSKCQDVTHMPLTEASLSHPVMGTAARLVARKSPGLKDVAESAYEWAMFITRLKTLVGRGDVRAVCEEYGGEPWHTYRRKYRELREGPHGFFRQVSFQVELKTDF